MDRRKYKKYEAQLQSIGLSIDWGEKSQLAQKNITNINKKSLLIFIKKFDL